MSTNINITVGDNALLDRAKQQQTANRQAQLNREASTRLEAQATAARTTALAAQGRDTNGNLITGAPFTQPQIDRRPAANRQGDVHILLVPDQNYGPYGVLARTKKIRNLNFCDVGFLNGEPPYKYDTFSLIAFPGTEANAFAASSLPITPSEPVNVFRLNYIVTDNTFVQAVGQSIPQRVIVDGEEQAWVSSIKAKDLPIYTFEAYVRMGDGTDIPLEEGSVEAQIFVSFMQTDIRFVLTGNFDTYQRRWGILVSDNDSFFELDPRFPDLPGSGVPDSGSEQGQWRHVAYVRDRTESRFYLDGILSGRGDNAERDETQPIKGYVEITNGLGNGFVNSAFHGYRVTPKVLYTANFTPPTAITGFA